MFEPEKPTYLENSLLGRVVPASEYDLLLGAFLNLKVASLRACELLDKQQELNEKTLALAEKLAVRMI